MKFLFLFVKFLIFISNANEIWLNSMSETCQSTLRLLARMMVACVGKRTVESKCVNEISSSGQVIYATFRCSSSINLYLRDITSMLNVQGLIVLPRLIAMIPLFVCWLTFVSTLMFLAFLGTLFLNSLRSQILQEQQTRVFRSKFVIRGWILETIKCAHSSSNYVLSSLGM